MSLEIRLAAAREELANGEEAFAEYETAKNFARVQAARLDIDKIETMARGSRLLAERQARDAAVALEAELIEQLAAAASYEARIAAAADVWAEQFRAVFDATPQIVGFSPTRLEEIQVELGKRRSVTHDLQRVSTRDALIYATAERLRVNPAALLPFYRHQLGTKKMTPHTSLDLFVLTASQVLQEGGTDAIYEGIPKALAPHVDDDAFETEVITFGGFHDGKAWTLRGNAKPLVEDFAILTGKPAAYALFAEDYYEIDRPSTKDVAHTLAGEPLDAAIVKRLAPDLTLAKLKKDLAEIGYGT